MVSVEFVIVMYGHRTKIYVDNKALKKILRYFSVLPVALLWWYYSKLLKLGTGCCMNRGNSEFLVLAVCGVSCPSI